MCFLITKHPVQVVQPVDRLHRAVQTALSSSMSLILVESEDSIPCEGGSGVLPCRRWTTCSEPTVDRSERVGDRPSLAAHQAQGDGATSVVRPPYTSTHTWSWQRSFFEVQSHGTRPKYPDSTSCGEPTRSALHHNSDNLLARPGRLMSQSAESRLQEVPVYSRGRQANQSVGIIRTTTTCAVRARDSTADIWSGTLGPVGCFFPHRMIRQISPPVAFSCQPVPTLSCLHTAVNCGSR